MHGRVVFGVTLIVGLFMLAACSTVSTQPQPQPQPEQLPAPSLPSLGSISKEAEPGLYTKAFVAEAIRRYDVDGRDATLAVLQQPR